MPRRKGLQGKVMPFIKTINLAGEKTMHTHTPPSRTLGAFLHLSQFTRSVWRVVGAYKKISYALLVKAHIPQSIITDKYKFKP